LLAWGTSSRAPTLAIPTVASQIAATFPPRAIRSFAYRSTLAAPRPTTVAPREDEDVVVADRLRAITPESGTRRMPPMVVICAVDAPIRSIRTGSESLPKENRAEATSAV
jgi:hypothetical protein